MKTVIIGGGAAGASCAARLRRLDENMSITLLEKSGEISIANCGLPYYVSDVISERSSILVSSPERFRELYTVDIRLHTEVSEIKRAEKKVVTSTGEVFDYDKLVLATGSSPIVPPFEGLDRSRAFTVRGLSDADKVKAFIHDNNVKRAAVIGGGFIGIEMAENLAEMKIDTTVIELQSQILAPVDEEIAAFAQNELRDNGVHIILGDGVDKFEGRKIVLKSGNKVDFDMVILSIGVRPQVLLAKEAGLEVGRGIKVNDHMLTSDENIYSAGDSTEIKDFVTGDDTLIPLAGPANRQGRIIADNICGIPSVYGKSQGTSVVKVFGLTVASSGNNEKQLKTKNIPYLKTFIYSPSHAGYYPGAKQNLYKLLFNKEGKILGIQGVGREGTEKRVEVVATVMRSGGTVHELTDSELCYAPPYSSVKDAVNTLGMTSENILAGLYKPAFFNDLTEDAFLVDVRPEPAFKMGSVPGAISIPADQIRNRLNEFPKDRKIILICLTGYTSYVASRILMQHGFCNVYSMCGGLTLYKELVKNKKTANS